MRRLLAVALLPFWAAPVAAQQMDSSMPGMNMPGPTPPAKSAPTPSPGPTSQGSMAGMTMPPAANPPDADIPQTPPPPPALDHLADRFYDPAAMAAARRDMRMEMGGGTVSKVMLNLAEYQAGSGGGGYRWDGQATFGGDIDRLVLRSEGEGGVKDGLETAEAQALYSRAVTTYFDLQAGVRQDFAPRGRTYVTVGTQGLFPYWFNVEAAVFLSTRGEFLARVEGTYDFRLTQRVVLQPRAELNFAAQDTPQTRTGSGLSDAELGLRLRYEIRREFAPYIGVSYDRRVGRTADYVRAAGEDPGSVNFVVGLRSWF
jgi:copper resistance protein B